MIVRDEEAQLSRALASIPDNYEKIVVDTGSKDRSKEIAVSFGAKVFEYKWHDDFADARNESMSHASGAYLFILDADEAFTDWTAKQIDIYIARNPSIPGIVRIDNHIEDNIHKTQMIRMIPNNSNFHYGGAVHEQLYQGSELARAQPSGISIHHYGYEPELYERKGKAKRYYEMYSRILDISPNDGYTLYQLGKLDFSLKRYARACAAFERCMSLREENRVYFPPMIVLYGYALKYEERSAEAELLLIPYADRYRDFPDLPFLMGLLAMDTGNFSLIESSFKRALAIGETSSYPTHHGVGTFKALYNLGIYYEVTGNKRAANECYAAAAQQGYLPAMSRLKNLT